MRRPAREADWSAFLARALKSAISQADSSPRWPVSLLEGSRLHQNEKPPTNPRRGFVCDSLKVDDSQP
jgi:hypothetical protein